MRNRFVTCLRWLFLLASISALCGVARGAQGPQPSVRADLKPGLYARFETTMGNFVVELNEREAPETVANFVGLADGTKEWIDPRTDRKQTKPYYDGLTFHRVIDGFIIQGGDPLGSGAGGPGFTIKDEISALRHDKAGMLAMARTSEPNSAGGQFYITLKPAEYLDGLRPRFVVFGEVIDGLDVVMRIGKVEIGREDRPRQPVIITRIRTERVAAKTAANAATPVFVAIPPGNFMMGCSPQDNDCGGDEKPARHVTITKAFEIGKYEVTQEQWLAVMGTNPSHFKGDNLPVDSVSWSDAQEFLRKLNSRNDGFRYRLPTEAEWEYAARAGTTGRYPGNLDPIALEKHNSENEGSHPVGKMQPNAWGMYDVLGNMFEWVQDWFGPYSGGEQTDPQGPAGGSLKVLRGGAWFTFAEFMSVSKRDRRNPSEGGPDTGLRVVREAIR